MPNRKRQGAAIHAIRVAFICVLLPCGKAGAQASPSAATTDGTVPDGTRVRVTFSAMGDVPYSPKEIEALPIQVAEIPSDSEFVVHVGDIKGGGPPCVEPYYRMVADMLRGSRKPTFIVPGDNEWNDCKNVTPEESWSYWHRHFSRLEQYWTHRFGVCRQLERDENFSFVRNEVLFVGLNVVGGRIHDRRRWDARLQDCVDWLNANLRQHGQAVRSLVVFAHATPTANHAVFFVGLEAAARRFGKPVLYLHGDGHRWVHDHPFAAENILRVQVDQGGIAPPLTVSVTDHPTEPFVFDRRMKATADR